MLPVSTFFTRLMPNVAGCPEPLAQQALVDAAIEFCDLSLIIVERLDPITVGLTDLRSFEIDLPSQMKLSQIMSVELDDRLLQPAPSYNVYGTPDQPGTPTTYYTTEFEETFAVTLVPRPDKEFMLQVTAALKPSRTATNLPNKLFEEYADYILAGAFSRLMSMPGQMWSDPVGAAGYMAQFRHGLSVARNNSMRGRVRSSLSVAQRPFA